MAKTRKIKEFINEVKKFQSLTGNSLSYIYSNNKCLNGKTFKKLIETGQGTITTDTWDTVSEWMESELNN
jgi:hypothetical protein